MRRRIPAHAPFERTVAHYPTLPDTAWMRHVSFWWSKAPWYYLLLAVLEIFDVEHQDTKPADMTLGALLPRRRNTG